MAPLSFTMNGTAFYPSDIRHKRVKKGRELEAKDGTPHVFIRGAKHEWELTFDGVTNAVRNAIEAVSALTTTFSITDERGASYTALCPLDSYEDGIAIIAAGVTLYYSVTLRLRQA